MQYPKDKFIPGEMGGEIELNIRKLGKIQKLGKLRRKVEFRHFMSFSNFSNFKFNPTSCGLNLKSHKVTLYEPM